MVATGQCSLHSEHWCEKLLSVITTAPPGIEPRASGLSRQCSATELRRLDSNHPPSKPLLPLLEAIVESQRPWVQFPAVPLFLSSPCRFKGLRTVAAPIVSFIDMITIGLRTTEESCPSDSSTAVIMLNNFSHQLTHTAITLHLSFRPLFITFLLPPWRRRAFSIASNLTCWVSSWKWWSNIPTPRRGNSTWTSCVSHTTTTWTNRCPWW